MILLHIETSTTVCSVAVSRDGACVFKKSNFDGMNHATMLSPFIAEAMEFVKSTNKTIDAVAVSGGPGSYTGLRIGVSTAKGLCYGLNVPLIVVDTLQVMTVMAMNKVSFVDNPVLYCPMIDARRMEVYAAVFNSGFETVKPVSAVIVDEDSFSEELADSRICFFGNGADKCKPVIVGANAFFIDDIVPLAENMITLAEKKFKDGDFEDVAYYEPFYLKEFQVTTPKNKL